MSEDNKEPDKVKVTYGFDEAIQIKILAMLIFKPELAKGVVNAEHFGSQILKDIAGIALGFWEKYQKPIGVDELMEELRNFLSENESHIPQEEVYWEVLEEAVTCMNDDFSYVRDRVVDFARYQGVKAVIIESVDLLQKKKDYDGILKKITQACSIGQEDQFYLRQLSEVEETEPKWLWPNRIPLNTLSVIAGEPGAGKSTLMYWIASVISAGKSWPFEDRSSCVEGSVILLSAEDRDEDAIAPIVRVNGGNKERIFTIHAKKGRFFNLEHDLKTLEKLIERTPDVKLIVIDPASSYVGGELNIGNIAKVAGILNPLIEMAERRGITIIAVMHTNKKFQENAMGRVAGSLGGWIGIPRGVWIVGKKEDSEERALLKIKVNRALPGLNLRFKMENVEKWPRVEFVGETSETATEALVKPEAKDLTKLAQAKELLIELLGDGGQVWSKDIFDRGEAEGISKDALKNAKRVLGGDSIKREGVWYWFLPDRQEKEK